MSILAAPEHDSQFDLVSFFEKASGMPDLELEIMIIGLGPHLDFLEFNTHLLLARLRSPLGLLILVLAIVHDTANRRIGLW